MVSSGYDLLELEFTFPTDQKITHMAKRSTREKLLSYLSEQAVKNKSAEFTIPYNRQQLADYLGVDRSGLSVQLCRLRDEGLLTFHKNKIRLIYKDSIGMI